MANFSDLSRLIRAKDEIVFDYRRRLVGDQAAVQDSFLPGREYVAATHLPPSSIPMADSPDERLAVGVSIDEGGRLHLDVKPAGERARNVAEEVLSRFGAAEVRMDENTVADRINMAAAPSVAGLRDRVRPLFPGVSVGLAEGKAGTLGVFVEIDGDETASSRVGFLSAASVLAPEGHRSIGHPVFQPAGSDADRDGCEHKIAVVRDVVFIVPTYANRLDVALAELTEDIAAEIRGNIFPPDCGCPWEGQPIGRVNGEPASWLGKTVGKVGRTTAYTQGEITAVSIDGLSVSNGERNIVFDDVCEIRSKSLDVPFAAPGDEGSLVFLEPKTTPIGLIFAMNKTATGSVAYACRLDLALKSLGVHLLPAI